MPNPTVDSNDPEIDTAEVLREALLEGMLKNEAPEYHCSCLSFEPDQDTPRYMCIDCDSHHATCKACIVERHALLPLHRIRRWDGSHYKLESLSQLGLIFHVGHGEKRCPHEVTAENMSLLTILDITGLHSVRIGWCRCASAPSPYRQLLTHEMVPSTVLRPRTAFTFRVLKLFHMFTHVCRMSAWDFCQSMLQLTDNVDTGTLPVSH
jgi:hypothetical protein